MRLFSEPPDISLADRTQPPTEVEPPRLGQPVLDRRAVLRGAAAAALVLPDTEALRRRLADAVDQAAMSEASLDDWEHTVQQYGLASRFRPAASLLTDLTADFAELCRLLESRRAILVPNRLTRIMAQLARLVTASFNRLDHPAAARNRARIAKRLAREAGDRQLHASVLTAEAVTHYYRGNLPETVHLATEAQHVAGQAPCASGAYGAAMEARAQALLGRGEETHAALARAERALEGLDAQGTAWSTFGYSEARFHFHAGNAYTHLGETAAASDAQDRALARCPHNDYLDRALVLLDRAAILTQVNDVPAAAEFVTSALQEGGVAQRDAMIDNRARQVLVQLSAKAGRSPAVRDLHDLLSYQAG